LKTTIFWEEQAKSWKTGIQLPAQAGIVLFPTASRPALGPTKHSIKWVPGVLFKVIKRPVREGDQSLLPTPKLITRGAIPPLPHTSSWRSSYLRTEHVFMA